MISWERAFHAFGPARGGHELLDVLRRGELERYACEHPREGLDPYSFLWSALYCAGRITPATVLGLRYLASALTAEDFGGDDPTLREAVVWWLREVTRAVVDGTYLDQARRMARRRDDPAVNEWLDEYLRHERSVHDWGEGDEPGRVLLAAAEADCFDALPEVFEPVASLLVARQPERLRTVAASAAAALVRHPELHRRREAITAYHLAEAARGTPLHRASMLLGLGELGGPTLPWLDDPDLGVRVCAALAPDLAGTAAATRVLRSAALDPAALHHAFGDVRLPQLLSLNEAVAEALCERVEDLGPLLDGATAAVAYDGPAGDGVLCEPYLRKAFPRGVLHGGTDAHRALARAVAASDNPWRDDKRWTAVFARTGLPAEREAWLAAARSDG
ncbi:hypothetical protein [Dactylosporangium salmoneum]|uniref:hypothetical protein n=1 Tax=Dactylosporangium salmoneum TaxID=53361 RepID=UPI0031D6FF66